MNEYAINFESITTGVKYIEAENIHEAYKIFEKQWENFDDIDEIVVDGTNFWEPLSIEGDDGRCWLNGEEPDYEVF
mgnify:CR=1 FL=1